MKMIASERVVQIVNIWMASDLYLKHAGNKRICEEVAQLCGTDTLRIWHDQIQYKPPVTGGPTAGTRTIRSGRSSSRPTW